VLINVEDLALGHTTKLRWNESGKWVWSERIVQQPIIDRKIFDRVRVMISGRATAPAEHNPHRRQHPYALRECLQCRLCGRRMQSHWVNDAPCYRCRFPAECAVANQVKHPLNVNLREDAVIGHVGRVTGPRVRPAPSRQDDQPSSGGSSAAEVTRAVGHEETARRIAECERRLAQYRAARDAGASAATVVAQIAETGAEKARYQLATRPGSGCSPTYDRGSDHGHSGQAGQYRPSPTRRRPRRQGGGLPATEPETDLPPGPTASRGPSRDPTALANRECPRSEAYQLRMLAT
jgi:site-specific DNA recombinase